MNKRKILKYDFRRNTYAIKCVIIPKLGFGTWFINDKDVVQAVKEGCKNWLIIQLFTLRCNAI
jgi:hypothetical protein